jgi:hypothetical protein
MEKAVIIVQVRAYAPRGILEYWNNGFWDNAILS